MSRDLREVVARAICKADGKNPDGWADGMHGIWVQRDWRVYRKQAQAALAAARPVIERETREACAKVAENAVSPYDKHSECQLQGGFDYACDAIAAAIRAKGQ
jgi:hypothetical protein